MDHAWGVAGSLERGVVRSMESVTIIDCLKQIESPTTVATCVIWPDVLYSYGRRRAHPEGMSGGIVVLVNKKAIASNAA